jgi:DNA-directed RNA polymerase subunit M/transcription elongation factor TFIIS
MEFSIECQSCGQPLTVTKRQLGRIAKCPVCSAEMKLPEPVDLGPRLKATPPVNPAGGKREAKSLPSFGISCPSCHTRMRLLEKYRGTVVRCPDCNEPFTAEIPKPATEDEEESKGRK